MEHPKPIIFVVLWYLSAMQLFRYLHALSIGRENFLVHFGFIIVKTKPRPSNTIKGGQQQQQEEEAMINNNIENWEKTKLFMWSVSTIIYSNKRQINDDVDDDKG